jgi:NAD(P)-dependent dehydrogenase (short-subunit alcohol dehydrogenase family)
MAGKVCVVTGATSGIGRATAGELARMGARLVLVGRDRTRGEDAAREIASATGNPAIDVMIADLASQRAIRELAAAILARHSRLHVLVNNAGVVNLHHSTTSDGIETVFAVNHLAYFVLTLLLLERLKASAPARIVNVASEAHRFGAMDFDDLGHARRYKAMRVYAQSKLANVLFTRELARRIAGSGVTANCLHPGTVATRLGQNNGRFATVVTKILAPFFRSPERGAETSIHLASSPSLEHVNGKYFVKCREATPSRKARDDDAAARLWAVSAAMTGVTGAA